MSEAVESAEQPPLSAKSMTYTALCGMAMGAADIIPGVSGGTVALVLGIYERLVTAISRCDAKCASHLIARRFPAAAQHIDLGFLLLLGFGVVVGILASGSVIHGLLEDDFTRPLTWAAFFGMIAASAWIVAKTIQLQSKTELFPAILIGFAAAAFAYWLTTLEITSGEQPGNGYLFLCGMIAICAMILPGISGAHILLLLGAYMFVTGTIKDSVHGKFDSASLLSLTIFACGCAIGLISFSKVLRWLLANCHTLTMAALCGFMIGALRKVWPFQLKQVIELGGEERTFYTPRIPAQFGFEEGLAVTVAVCSLIGVLVVDYFACSMRKGGAESASK
mgnify:CR=1 FL=1